MEPNKILKRIPDREFFSEIADLQGARIAIFADVLSPGAIDIPYVAMLRWRSPMRQLSVEPRLHSNTRAFCRKSGTGFHTAALYSAFAIIAAIVFGTLLVHPF
jgi:hypothetical protein